MTYYKDMRGSILSTSILAILLAMLSLPAEGEPDVRWLPDYCFLALDVERALQTGEQVPESDEARWNRFYRLGIDAIARGDLDQAKLDFCQALDAAIAFPPRDYRFAETLDELGLIAFMGEDYAASEAMQGAAAAEMLLAVGPPDGDLAKEAAKSCKSSVATYMVRLGWIFERQGRRGEIDLLMNEPYRILNRGYVPPSSMRPRLDWLISRYLLDEDFAAADWLASLRDGE